MSVPCFYVAEFHVLKSAKNLDFAKLDGIWASISNDEFFRLSRYVSAFANVSLKGYRMTEDAGAFEACRITLQALADIVARMNQTKSLTDIARTITANPMSRDVTIQKVDAAWNDLMDGFTTEPGMTRLLGVVKGEFVSWTGGISGKKDVSELIKFGSKPAERDLELAFSGGGMRAAAFSLGVLLYVLDVGGGEWIRQISSVSGGSITNGFVADIITTGHGITGISKESVGAFARRLVSDGIPLEKAGRIVIALFLTTLLSGVLSGILVLAVALGASKGLLVWALLSFIFFGCVGLLTYETFRTTTGVIVAGWFGAVVTGSVVEPRKRGLADLFSLKRVLSALLSAKSCKLRPLRDIVSPITHVFTATDLRNGEHFHFSQHWVTSNTYGPSDPGDIRIDEAVRASAAFPGALPPIRIAVDRLRLPPQHTVGVRDLQLVDGGVRDNLGHVFQSQLLSDSDAQRSTLSLYGTTHQWIVADASAPRGVADLSENLLTRVPVLRRIGQLVAFPRVLSIMNQSNSEARSLALSTRFGSSSSGFVVAIRESPVGFCRRIIGDEEVARRLLRGDAGSGCTDDQRKVRAEAALSALVRNDRSAESHWNGECNSNQIVPTTLDGLKAGSVASLIRHGYVLAMCCAHVDFGWPLAPDPRWSVKHFADLVREEQPQAGSRAQPSLHVEAVAG